MKKLITSLILATGLGASGLVMAQTPFPPPNPFGAPNIVPNVMPNIISNADEINPWEMELIQSSLDDIEIIYSNINGNNQQEALFFTQKIVERMDRLNPYYLGMGQLDRYEYSNATLVLMVEARHVISGSWEWELDRAISAIDRSKVLLTQLRSML